MSNLLKALSVPEAAACRKSFESPWKSSGRRSALHGLAFVLCQAGQTLYPAMLVLSNQASEPELTSPGTEVAKMDDKPSMEVGNSRSRSTRWRFVQSGGYTRQSAGFFLHPIAWNMLERNAMATISARSSGRANDGRRGGGRWAISRLTRRQS
jgi:hypothetical protein